MLRVLDRLAARLAARYIEARTQTSLNRILTMQRTGRIDIDWHAYERLLTRAREKGVEAYSNVNGWSPGFVACLLGVSRQAVHDAIQRGGLTAYRITAADGELVGIVVTEASARAYAARQGRKLVA